MSMLDWVFESKTSRIFAMVMKLTTWSTGLDRRLSKIEIRLGAIEMGLAGKGIHLPPVDEEEERET